MIIKFLKAAIAFLVLLLNVQHLNAQKTFHTVIQIPQSVDGKNFLITYDDGLNVLTVKDTFVNKQLAFSGKLYSKFAVLKISYHNGRVVHYDEYFIHSLPSEIIFAPDADFSEDRNFHYSKLKNATEIYQSKIAQQRNEFSKQETDEMTRFWKKNNASFGKSDSLKNLFYEKLNNINKSDIDFIKKNGDEYYSFWLFRTQVIPNTFINKNASIEDFKNLLNVYNTTFPSSYKENTVGKRIENLLKGKITVQTKKRAPDFRIKDIEGKSITIKDFKGKYVLLDFWATWCAPCMAQLPFIKKIREDYSPDKLVIIGISADVDYKNFEAAIRKNKMNWIHIYGNTDLAPMYGVNAIPAVFLIDKNGTIIFRGEGEEKDAITELLEKKLH